MPEIPSSFRPASWLPGPHLPAIWGKFVRRRPMVHDRIERWATPDGDHLSMLRMGNPGSGAPHLLILHGLEARISAKYAHGLLDQARRRGWSGDLLMFRSCDGEINSARRLYHSGETTDLDFVVRRLVQENPGIRLVLAGVSLGGNVLLKWLGEVGDQAPQQVFCAAAVSVPFDLAAGSRQMEQGFARQYVTHFLATLKKKTLQKLIQYPGCCDVEVAMRAKTFWEFDDAVTAPLHGFAGAGDYYERSSSLRFLSRISRPTYLLSARGDPFLPDRVIEEVRSLAASSSMLFCEVTSTGGHVGWVEGAPWDQRYYMEGRVVQRLAAWTERRKASREETV